MTEIDLRSDANPDGGPPASATPAGPVGAAAPPGPAGATATLAPGATSTRAATAGRAGAPPAPTGTGPTRASALAALRALPFGGVDDGALQLRLPPPVHATVSPVVAALRWGSVSFAMVSAVTRSNKGDYTVVTALVLILFLTTWRTLRPVRLGSERLADRALPVTDTVAVGLAVGWSGALGSPFIFCVLACAVVGAFGWGLAAGMALAVLGLAAMAAGTLLGNGDFAPLHGAGPALLASMVLAVALSAFARARLMESEERRAGLAGQLNLLADTNELLGMLNQLARTLPQALDLREALARAREELQRAFNADVIALVSFEEASGNWTPRITENCTLHPAPGTDDLPEVLRSALASPAVLLVPQLPTDGGLSARSGSGVYTAVRTRDRIVGVVGVEHRTAGTYTAKHRRLMEGMAEVLALTLDNARSFQRLRMLGAEQERSRIARDLHDRLGQWLTYISFELERIITTSTVGSSELDRLYADVQTAIGELRETLRQLRAEVTDDRPLAVVGAEVVSRFNEHGESGVLATFEVTDPSARLAPRVENELLRVLQEALSNVAKHANAHRVDVVWDVTAEWGTLTVSDDGDGFDPASGARATAYGLVGMRERADMVGAQLDVRSSAGNGTTITVQAARTREESYR